MLALIGTKHLLVEVHITFRNLMGSANSLQQLTTAPLAKIILSLTGAKKGASVLKTRMFITSSQKTNS